MSKDTEEQLIYKERGDDGEIVYKVIVIGDPSIGKTSLIRKFVNTKFSSQYIPTVGVDITKQPVQIEFGGKKLTITLMLWDLAGQPQFHLLHKVYCNGANGVLLGFDLTKSFTYSNVKNWHQMVVKHGLRDVPMILFGNKADLKDQRTVTDPHVDHLKEQLGISDYFETSALEGQNVQDLFKAIAQRIYEVKNNK
jgi:small GTP-binding protein